MSAIQISRQKCPLIKFRDKATQRNLNNILIIFTINLVLDSKSDNHFHDNSVLETGFTEILLLHNEKDFFTFIFELN